MGLFSRLFGKKPKRPDSTRGQRGTGRGGLHAGEVEDFVHDGQLLIVSSSNVAAMQYHKAEYKLMVEFLNGSAYLYSPVSESLAYTLAEAPSKGRAIWDYFRVRGPGGDHHTKPGITCVRIR